MPSKLSFHCYPHGLPYNLIISALLSTTPISALISLRFRHLVTAIAIQTCIIPQTGIMLHNKAITSFIRNKEVTEEMDPLEHSDC